MLSNERHEKILTHLREHRTATVGKLAALLFVSEATVRRDLCEMQRIGLIERSHGGAFLPENSDDISVFVRITKNAKEKERLATTALPLLPNFKTVFIDSSTTAFALGERMDLSNKTVITNSLQTAAELSKKPNTEVILLGGTLHLRSNSVTGSWTAAQVKEFSFDLLLMSCAAVDRSVALERTMDQSMIKRCAFEQSARRILLVDHTKFSERGSYRMMPLSAFDMVISDKQPDAPIDPSVHLYF